MNEFLDVGVVCALRCEGRPLIQQLGLESSGERVFAKDGVALAISGVGMINAQSAVRRLSAQADRATCWLNVGCAGGIGEIGELVVAHRVSTDEGDSWFPQFPFPVDQATGEVRTVAQPETRYPEPVLYDMEAAGFYPEALKLVSLERVQVIKVRVDGPEQGIDQLDAGVIERAMAEHTSFLVEWVERLAEVAKSVRSRRPDRSLVAAFQDRWRFTASQQVQLQRALERIRALEIETPQPEELNADSARAALAQLREALSRDGDSESAG